MYNHTTPKANDVWSGWFPCRGTNPVKNFRAGEYAVRIRDTHEFEPACDTEQHEWGTHYVTHYRYKWRRALELVVRRAQETAA